MAYTTDANGNYKRTVRCGYCYETGHNKSSCETRKESHKSKIAIYEQKLAKDDFCDDRDREYTKQLLERHKSQLEKSSNRGKNRKCSYCKDGGHTRTTCSFRKGDIKSWTAKTLDAREKFVEKMADMGLGVGALGVCVDPYAEESILVMVEHVAWDSIDHRIAVGGENQWAEILRVRSTRSDKQYPQGRQYNLLLPTDITEIYEDKASIRHSRGRSFKIHSPVQTAAPDDFLTIDSAVKAAAKSYVFNDARTYEYYGIEYDE